MRRPCSAVSTLAAAVVLGAGALTAPAAVADPAGQRVPHAGGLLGNGLHHDVDRRRGDRPPTAGQRAAARRSPGVVRWNDYGTPATVSSAGSLATGLPADHERAARTYLDRSRELFGLGAGEVAAMETLAVVPVGKGALVTLRQRVGGLPLTQGGLVTVAVRDGQVWHVSTSLTRATARRSTPVLSSDSARRRAFEVAGLEAGSAQVLRTRRVAVPTATEGTRTAFEVVVAESGGEGAAYTVLVDATTGQLLVREDLVDHFEDNPTWDLFGSTPPDTDSTERERWCWAAAPGCDDVVGNAESPFPWDVDPESKEPTDTTDGNNALSGKAWTLVPNVAEVERTAAAREDRNYAYTFDNIWADSGCAPSSLGADGGNDIDAATSSLFAHHNRLHDWAYQLGFTEQTWNAQQSNLGNGGAEDDPEIGKAQSGALLGYRDNANQYTPPDGVAPWSNMYLWQPIAGGAYVPCVDGDFDGTVIGHEYTHMITNRMIAGPDDRLTGYQARGMGEGWSDLVAMEYLFELGRRPKGNTPYITGGYVTGDDRTGIRNYDMSRSTLNYSDVGYDVVGMSVHSEGEIWSATNFTVRQALIERYGRGSAALQRSCADGETPVDQCPGNRRWIQLLFDSLLVPATGEVSMVDMRDAMLVADKLRFGGANQDLLWAGFAQRGLGQGTSSAGTNDTDPVPSFASPTADNADITFRVGGVPSGPVRFYIGEYEKQVTPVADTDPSTELDDRVRMVPGSYAGVAVGPQIGHHRFTFTVRPGERQTVPAPVASNVAAAANGATVTGDGSSTDALIDGTEGTSWEASAADVEGLGAVVDLAGDEPQQVNRVNVSAFYANGSRFSALRQFAVLSCDATTGADCSDDAAFELVYVSPPDAFPGDGMRPTAPDLNIASFTIPTTSATHLRLEVVTNQCTGGPDFQGDQDNDPATNTDCPSGAPSVAQTVRAAEFQAFQR